MRLLALQDDETRSFLLHSSFVKVYGNEGDSCNSVLSNVNNKILLFKLCWKKQLFQERNPMRSKDC